MDPALQELLEGDPSEEIEAIIKLKRPGEVPPYVRLVARFGDIATCRLERRRIREVWASESVVSLKAPRLLEFDREIDDAEAAFDIELRESDERHPSTAGASGHGVVIGVVDLGCDFAHPNFCKEDGSTRLLTLWDQSNQTPSVKAEPYGYGVVYSRDDINRALASSNPYETLGYHPVQGDPLKNGAHGTHVLDIAAGNGRVPGSPVGIAPEADIIFVHLAARGVGGEANLGDSVRILEALDFIAREAGDKPWVDNISMGSHAGPHKGLTLVEQGMDALLLEAPERAIAESTGNYFEARAHASGQIHPGQKCSFIWWTDKADITPNELEVWYSGRDRLRIEFQPPEGDAVFGVDLGENSSIRLDGREVGRIYHRAHDPNNGDNHVDIFLQPGAPAGPWRITLIGEDIVDGRFHAWVERDAGCFKCQSRFDAEDADPTCTTGTICNGFQTIAVGAYNPHSPVREIATFSSSGPTRDGRLKPNLIAPGVEILAARSAPYDAPAEAPLLTRKSGASMAAPEVTGTIALMFEAARRPLWIHETRKLLLSSTQSLEVDPETALRVGSGYLDIERAVNAARKFTEEEHVVNQSIDSFASTTTKPETIGELPPGSEDTPEVLMSNTQKSSQVEGTENQIPEKREEIEEEESRDDFESDNKWFKEKEEYLESQDFFTYQDDEAYNDYGEIPYEAYPGTEMSGTRFVDLVEEVISSREVSRSSDSLLKQVFSELGLAEALNPLGEESCSFFSPATIFDAFAPGGSPALRRHFEQFFEVVTEPGAMLKQDIEAGNILLRCAYDEGNLAQVSMLVTGEILSQKELDSARLHPESWQPGFYGHIIEAGPRQHTRSDCFARRVLDSARRMPSDQILLRVKKPRWKGISTEKSRSYDVEQDYFHQNFMAGYFDPRKERENKEHIKECLKFRRNLPDYINCLLEKARYKWEYLVGKYSDFGRFGGRFGRKFYKEHPFVHSVTRLDRTRIVALLEGCLDENAEYLDLKEFRKFFDKFRSKLDPMAPISFINAIKKNLKNGLVYPPNKNYPTGCLKINHHRDKDVTYFSEPYGGINELFSNLLKWDTQHCYGLLLKILAHKEAMGQGSGVMGHLQTAVQHWIDMNRDKTIYNRYPSIEKAGHVDNPELDYL